jgi:hypothetical protein
MERIRQARAAGTIGIVVAALWLVNWAFETFVDPPIGGGAWYAGQILATILLLGTAVLMFGLAALRPAGDGRVARTILALPGVAWLSLAVGGIGMLIRGDEETGPLTVFFPIGGILGTLALLVGGILIAVRGRIPGWQRWMTLVFAAGYVLVGLVQGGGDEMTTASQTAELVLYLLLMLLAVAVRTATPVATGPAAHPVRV